MIEELPLISIIVPVYNVELYIDRCVSSVVNQTYRNLHIILVDDGSSDNSAQLCDEWSEKDGRIEIVHKKNGGQSQARNTALEIVRGDYIGFVDSDDWIEPDMYEYLYRMIKKYNADVSFCEYDRGGKSKIFPDKVTVREGEENVEFFYRLHGERSSYAVWRGLYKTSAVKGITFKEGLINEDVLYQYEVMHQCPKMVYGNQAKYHYFLNDMGITRSLLNRKDYSLIQIWDCIVENEKETKYYTSALLNRKRVPFTLYCKYLRYGNKDVPKEQIQEWRNELKESRHFLMMGNFLDWKRKILLVLITII